MSVSFLPSFSEMGSQIRAVGAAFGRGVWKLGQLLRQMSYFTWRAIRAHHDVLGRHLFSFERDWFKNSPEDIPSVSELSSIKQLPLFPVLVLVHALSLTVFPVLGQSLISFGYQTLKALEHILAVCSSWDDYSLVDLGTCLNPHETDSRGVWQHVYGLPGYYLGLLWQVFPLVIWAVIHTAQSVYYQFYALTPFWAFAGFREPPVSFAEVGNDDRSWLHRLVFGVIASPLWLLTVIPVNALQLALHTVCHTLYSALSCLCRFHQPIQDLLEMQDERPMPFQVVWGILSSPLWLPVVCLCHALHSLYVIKHYSFYWNLLGQNSVLSSGPASASMADTRSLGVRILFGVVTLPVWIIPAACSNIIHLAATALWSSCCAGWGDVLRCVNVATGTIKFDHERIAQPTQNMNLLHHMLGLPGYVLGRLCVVLACITRVALCYVLPLVMGVALSPLTCLVKLVRLVTRNRERELAHCLAGPAGQGAHSRSLRAMQAVYQSLAWNGTIRTQVRGADGAGTLQLASFSVLHRVFYFISRCFIIDYAGFERQALDAIWDDCKEHNDDWSLDAARGRLGEQVHPSMFGLLRVEAARLQEVQADLSIKNALDTIDRAKQERHGLPLYQLMSGRQQAPDAHRECQVANA